MLEQLLDFTGCSNITFFKSTHSPNTISEAIWCDLPLTVQCLCDLWDAMSLHWPPGTFHLNPCVWKQKIYPAVRSILKMGLCPHTQLTSHQKILLGRFCSSVRTATEHYINLPLVLNLLINSFICFQLPALSTRPHNTLTLFPSRYLGLMHFFTGGGVSPPSFLEKYLPNSIQYLVFYPP